MTRKTWVLVIASVLPSSILLEGQVVAAGKKKIVVFLDGTSSQVQQTTVATVGLIVGGITVVHTLSFINALAMEVLNADQVNQAVELLLNYTTLSGVHPVQEVGDDPVFSILPITPADDIKDVPLPEAYDWGLKHICVDEAHQEMQAVTGAGVKVAIVDTGIDCVHPELPYDHVLDGFNALPGGVSSCDDHGHGTHIAGIIAARQNPPGVIGAGIIGAAPEANLVAVKVLDVSGKGYLSYLINGLQWIWSYNNEHQNKIQLVNMSLGFAAGSSPLEAAIEKLSHDHGTIMVAAAGNSCGDPGHQDEDGGDEGQGACDTTQTDRILYPAASPAVLAVTATNYKDLMTYYSLSGSAVDVTASGGERINQRILSTYLGGRYGYGSGTSQAAAHVTGALALKLQQQQLLGEPPLSLQDVQSLLQETATPLQRTPQTEQGWGLINAERLLDPESPPCKPQ